MRADLDPNLVRSWPEEQRHELYRARSTILLEALEGDDKIKITTLDDRAKLMAAFSLTQEGFIIVDSKEQTHQLRLAEDGHKFATGTKALRYG